MREINCKAILNDFLARSRKEIDELDKINEDVIFSIINSEIQKVFGVDSEEYLDFKNNISTHFCTVKEYYINSIFSKIKEQIAIGNSVYNSFSKSILMVLLIYMALDSEILITESSGFIEKYEEKWNLELDKINEYTKMIVSKNGILLSRELKSLPKILHSYVLANNQKEVWL